jgi:predicted PurR-regulated permease PerM
MIDSLIIGLICFAGMWALKAPYALLMSIIIGVTNMIPYFGPFIGAVPAIIITLFSSPVTAIWVAVFILILQQLDGYIIGPFILGDSVGLSPFWIILAILIGGGLFGVLGMLICVPVMAIVRNQFSRYINKRLDEKNLSLNDLAQIEE